MSKSMVKAFRVLGLALLLAAGMAVALAGSGLAADAKDQPALVFGHMNPDMDSVATAVGAAYLLNQRGIKAEAAAQGPSNPEAAWVLKQISMKDLPVIGAVAGKKVALVDFADYPQGPKDLKEAEIAFIVDHHKLGGIATDAPLEVWMMPVGSASTVLYQMYKYYNVAVPKDVATLMTSAILSDTVIFKSVTCTDLDKKAAEELAGIAGIKDLKARGIEQFNAKSDFGARSPRDLVTLDYKDFTMNGRKVGVGQLEVVDLKVLQPLKLNFLKAMNEIKNEKGLESIFLMLTDIMQESTLLLAVTDNPAIVKKAWKLDLKDSEVWMPGVMSRKKQIIPQLEDAYK